MMGAEWAVFIGLTVVLFGGVSWMTGQAVAATWRPVWQVLVYAFLLALFDRFLAFSLFAAPLLSLAGFLRDLGVIVFVSLVSWRFTRAAMMVRQYPWRYVRAGPFGWRQKGG